MSDPLAAALADLGAAISDAAPIASSHQAERRGRRRSLLRTAAPVAVVAAMVGAVLVPTLLWSDTASAPLAPTVIDGALTVIPRPDAVPDLTRAQAIVRMLNAAEPPFSDADGGHQRPGASEVRLQLASVSFNDDVKGAPDEGYTLAWVADWTEPNVDRSLCPIVPSNPATPGSESRHIAVVLDANDGHGDVYGGTGVSCGRAFPAAFSTLVDRVSVPWTRVDAQTVRYEYPSCATPDGLQQHDGKLYVLILLPTGPTCPGRTTATSEWPQDDGHGEVGVVIGTESNPLALARPGE
jgi:hypothetical protein